MVRPPKLTLTTFSGGGTGALYRVSQLPFAGESATPPVVDCHMDRERPTPRLVRTGTKKLDLARTTTRWYYPRHDPVWDYYRTAAPVTPLKNHPNVSIYGSLMEHLGLRSQDVRVTKRPVEQTVTAGGSRRGEAPTATVGVEFATRIVQSGSPDWGRGRSWGRQVIATYSPVGLQVSTSSDGMTGPSSDGMPPACLLRWYDWTLLRWYASCVPPQMV